MSFKTKLSKNIIFIYSFVFITLLSTIYYLLYINAKLQLSLKTLSAEEFDSYFTSSTFFLLFLILVILFNSQYFHLKLLKAKNLKLKSRTELETINNFFNTLQSFHNLPDISKQSLKSLGKEFGAFKAKIYIVDYLNEQLCLSGTLNMEVHEEEKTLEVYRGALGEAVAFKKIKYWQVNETLQVIIPLVVDKRTIAAMIFYIRTDDKSYEITKFHKTLINIISDFIHKEIKNEENKKYFNLIDNYVLMSSTNKEGIITHTSKAFSETLGYKEEELLGQPHSIIRSKNVKNDIFKDMWKRIEDGKIWNNEIENTKKDNSSCWLDTTIQPQFDYHNNVIGYTAIRVDITDKKIVEKLSITDAMTNLFNRRYFDSIFPKKLSLAKRFNKEIAFCMMDIDHFKQYNDNYGHQEGDNALIAVAKSLQKSLQREGDFIFRLGGEEFGMLYFIKDENDALDVANKTLKNIENLQIEHKQNSASNYVTVSMGLYIYNSKVQEISPEEIYLQTDKLLYKSKQNGRNQITL